MFAEVSSFDYALFCFECALEQCLAFYAFLSTLKRRQALLRISLRWSTCNPSDEFG